MGVFIIITADEDRIPEEAARRVARACPVDIYGVEEGKLVIRPEQVDECILCRLCLEQAPAGTLRIYKTYSGETWVSEGPASP